jgi:phosphoglycerol transferase MdoB-like AlkP superfamily enzyme
MKKYITLIKKNLTDVFIISLLAGFVLSLTRVQESFFLENFLYDKYEAYNSLIFTSFVDIKASIVFSILLIPFVFIKKGFRVIASLFYLVFIISNSILTKYYLTNFDLLGDELLKFYFSEFMFVVNAEKVAFSVFDMFLFYFYPILFLFLVFLFYKYFDKISKKAKTVLVGMFIVFLVASAIDYKYYFPKFSNFESYEKYTLNNNKFSYFLSETTITTINNSKPTIVENIDDKIKNYQQSRPEFNFIGKEYPFMHNEPYTNVLEPFFVKSETKPNVVFILVESLSRSFSGPNAELGSFTPFIDSLGTKSLYWTNFLSNAERTYGVLPNVLSSAPYFDQFVSNETYSKHSSLITELKSQGYYSDFHYGGWEGFSSRGRFVRESGIDDLYADHSFDTMRFKQTKTVSNESHWGYDDKDLFEQYFIHTKNIQEPFLSIMLTLTMHSPFKVKEDYTIEKVKEYLGDSLTAYQKELMMVHPKKIKAISFTDQYLKAFFETYKKKEAFKNTIFVILGDHNIHALPLKNELDLFHVPMMIYSDLLTMPKIFTGLSTHREILPSLLGLLENNYNLSFEEDKHWLGNNLDTSSIFNSDINAPMCLTASKYVKYIYKDNLVFKNEVYQFDSLLNMSIQRDTIIANEVMELYQDYSAIENYMMVNDKLYNK